CAAEHLRQELERQLVDGPSGDVQCDARDPAHRVHVAERVRGGDPAPIPRVVHEWGEEVQCQDEPVAVRESIHRCIVAGLLRDEHILGLRDRTEEVQDTGEVARTELASATGTVTECGQSGRGRHASEDTGGQPSSVPIAWKPPSTWISSPWIPADRSESRNATAFPTGVGSSTSQPSGARRSHAPLICSNPGIPLPAIVLIGPALTVFTRTLRGPRSRARYRVTDSSPAFATPIQS